MRTKTLKKNRINVVTLGCSKNVYDSEVLMGQLKASGKDVVHEQEGNVVVINTCGFINNAKEESVNTILHYMQQKEEGTVDKVFVTGCLSERYKPDLQKEIPNVDQYFGTTELPGLLKALGADYKHELIGERLTTTPKNYAYLKIAEGCDRPCSFCAIPLMRGKHKSTPIEELVTEAEKLAANGVKELILIAQDLTYYGLDLYKKRNLAELLEHLVKVEGIEWIRLHYAFPTGFPMDVLDIMKREPKICNYLDIPLQHISDAILKSMRRGTTMAKTTKLLQDFRAKVSEMTIRTTLIVGYPGETEEDFQTLKQWVKDMRFERLGCFTYSHEENTHAYQLEDDVPEEIRAWLIPGAESPFFKIEKTLAEDGFNRMPGEVMKRWLLRIGRPELLPMLAYHNRWRFDPHGISIDERKLLAGQVSEWLHQNEKQVESAAS